MARCQVRFVLMLLVLASARTAGAAVTTGAPITVRLYNAAALERTAVEAALDVARGTLLAALVDVAWERCHEERRCEMVMRTPELAVRLVRGPLPRGIHVLPLGDALVDAHTRTGVLATIYVDRVEWLAAASGQDLATLLGRAIAHELGHLLLATTTHSTRGLMRPVWSREELRLGRPADWAFSAPDVAAIHARLRGLPR